MAAADQASQELVTKFLSFGFDNKRAVDTVKNPALCAAILELAEFVGVSGGCDKSIGNLIYTASTKLSGDSKKRERAFLAPFIASQQLTSSQQLTEALKFLERVPADQDINEADFKAASGIGMSLVVDIGGGGGGGGALHWYLLLSSAMIRARSGMIVLD
jgi:glutaminyl-tRNA synthetase